MGETGVGGKKAYKIRSPEVWALARQAYLAGVPVDVIERVFDVTAHALRRRATREGWTKKDARAGTAEGLPAFEPLLCGEAAAGVGDSAESLAAAALRGVREGFRQGRLEEAGKLARTAAVLTRAAGKGGADGSLETIFRALTDREFRNGMFSLIGDSDNPIKNAYWSWDGEPVTRARVREDELNSLQHDVFDLRGILVERLGEAEARAAMKAARLAKLNMWFQGRPPAEALEALDAKYGPS